MHLVVALCTALLFNVIPIASQLYCGSDLQRMVNSGGSETKHLAKRFRECTAVDLSVSMEGITSGSDVQRAADPDAPAEES